MRLKETVAARIDFGANFLYEGLEVRYEGLKVRLIFVLYL